jgi:hypothetical protein
MYLQQQEVYVSFFQVLFSNDERTNFPNLLLLAYFVIVSRLFASADSMISSCLEHGTRNKNPVSEALYS